MVAWVGFSFSCRLVLELVRRFFDGALVVANGFVFSLRPKAATRHHILRILLLEEDDDFVFAGAFGFVFEDQSDMVLQ